MVRETDTEIVNLQKRRIMDYAKYITRDPNVMLGKPIIRGTRITVELIMRKFAGGFTIDKILESYSHLTREQILAAFEYTADLIANDDVREVA